MIRDILEETRLYVDHERKRLAHLYGVRSIAIFGSVVRGDGSKTSDVDVLVEMDSPTFDRYMDLKFELEDRLGLTVDLVLADAIKDRLRDAILREAVYV